MPRMLKDKKLGTRRRVFSISRTKMKMKARMGCVKMKGEMTRREGSITKRGGRATHKK